MENIKEKFINYFKAEENFNKKIKFMFFNLNSKFFITIY